MADSARNSTSPAAAPVTPDKCATPIDRETLLKTPIPQKPASTKPKLKSPMKSATPEKSAASPAKSNNASPPIMISNNHVVRINYACKHDQGKGVMAAEDIQAGALIMTEQPIFTTTFAFVERPQSQEEEDDLEQELRKMDAPVFNKLMAMTNNMSQYYDEKDKAWIPGAAISGTIRTNLIPLSLGRYQHRSGDLGVFLNLSKLNHSCRPNATQVWNPDLEEEGLYALEDIEAGEHITISYAPEARADINYIYKTYGFICACKWCVTKLTPDKVASEKNRVDIEILAREYEDMDDENPRLALENCYKRVLLNEYEGIVDWRKGLAFEDALNVALEEEDVERGTILAMLAFMAYWKCEGWETFNGWDLGEKYGQLIGDWNAEPMQEDIAAGKRKLLELVRSYLYTPNTDLISVAGLKLDNDEDVDDENADRHFEPVDVRRGIPLSERIWEELNAPIVRPLSEHEPTLLTWLFKMD